MNVYTTFLNNVCKALSKDSQISNYLNADETLHIGL